MRAIIQRVTEARVLVDAHVVGAIGSGLLVFLGVRDGDTEADAAYLAERCAALRIFQDAEDKMNLSLIDTGGSVLVISQFTLHADTRKGNRPSFIAAAKPELAEQLCQSFIEKMKSILGSERVATGIFRAMMQVELTNDGPVTILLQSKSEYAS